MALPLLVAACAFLHGAACGADMMGARATERIRWFNGTWDDTGAPRGLLLTDNPRWFGDRIFTGVTYKWETPPTWPKDERKKDGRTVQDTRLIKGYHSHAELGSVGREGDKPIVAVFDFKRPCEFSEIDLVSEHCTNAVGFVEFSVDGENWRGRRSFATGSAITRVRFDAGPFGRYLRLSFQATPDAIDDWHKKGRRGYTYLDEVLVWGEAEVSDSYPEAFKEIKPGDALLFTNVAKGVVTILPMPIPHLDRKPSGATPESFHVAMARNETENRYFAVVNGTSEEKRVKFGIPDFGHGVKSQLLIGGVMQVSPPKKKLSKEEMIQLATDDENGINKGNAADLDVLPFFFPQSRPKENFLRRYLANPAHVSGFPAAVPLKPGEGCIVMLRLTTDGAKPGVRSGVLAALTGDHAAGAALHLRLSIVDLELPPQRMWIYAYGPFTAQYPFEGETRMRRDVERYAGIGATTTRRLPAPGTKERMFFDLVPQATVGSAEWCDGVLYRRVTKGNFDTLTEDERSRIVADARAFLGRGRALGVQSDRIYAFLPDEPGVRNGKSVMSLARLVKTCVPELLIHCDPLFYLGGGRGFCTTAEIESCLLPEYNEFVDISCPISSIATRSDAMRSMWLKPRRINAMYNHPAGKTGREMVYSCYRNGFNGMAYYCYCHPTCDVWDIKKWGVLNLNYQAVMPLGDDVALTPLYETLREAAEDARMLDALRAAGRDGTLSDVLARSRAAWDRTHFQYKLKDAGAEDILALRETILSAFVTPDMGNDRSWGWNSLAGRRYWRGGRFWMVP